MNSIKEAARSLGLGPPIRVSDLAKRLNMNYPVSCKQLIKKASEGLHIPVPFWVIAHRKNDLQDVQEALEAGANAIECDIRWSDTRFVVQHDITDSSRNFLNWLNFVRHLSSSRYPSLSLVIFDYKTPEKGHVELLLSQIREHLTGSQESLPLNIIISVGSWDGRGALESIYSNLAPHEGVAIDYDVEPQKTSQYFDSSFRELHARNLNQAYGNGIAKELPEGSKRKQVMDAVALKAMESKIKFVYVWTLEKKDSVSEYLWMGVDGIFVDDPRIALEVMNRFPQRYRLALRKDRVFQPIDIPAYILTVKTGDEANAATDATITFRLVGEQGQGTFTCINSFKPNIFERGNMNLVTLRGKDVGRPNQLHITNDGSGNSPEWFLETVTVKKAGDPTQYSFPFNRWIKE